MPAEIARHDSTCRGQHLPELSFFLSLSFAPPSNGKWMWCWQFHLPSSSANTVFCCWGEKHFPGRTIYVVHTQTSKHIHARTEKQTNIKSKMHSCSIQMLFLKLIYCVVCQRHFSWFHQVDVVLRVFRDRGKTHTHARARTNDLWNELVINNVKTRPNYFLIKELCSYAWVFHGGMKAARYCGIQGAMTFLTLLLKQTEQFCWYVLELICFSAR